VSALALLPVFMPFTGFLIALLHQLLQRPLPPGALPKSKTSKPFSPSVKPFAQGALATKRPFQYSVLGSNGLISILFRMEMGGDVTT
jgi:hypothetical protein